MSSHPRLDVSGRWGDVGGKPVVAGGGGTGGGGTRSAAVGGAGAGETSRPALRHVVVHGKCLAVFDQPDGAGPGFQRVFGEFISRNGDRVCLLVCTHRHPRGRGGFSCGENLLSWWLHISSLWTYAPMTTMRMRKNAGPTKTQEDPCRRLSVDTGCLPGVHPGLEWVDERGATFGPAHLSDGTLRALALITALSQPEEGMPLVSCIDEPELGLHPAALDMLCGLISSVATRHQVIVSTQSPVILDHFEPEQVVVAERHQGETKFTKLDLVSLKVGWRTILCPKSTTRMWSGGDHDPALCVGRGADGGAVLGGVCSYLTFRALGSRFAP